MSQKDSHDEKSGKELVECSDDGKMMSQLEAQLQNQGIASISASKTMSKTASRSADVTGELMPFVLGQLQASLENIGASSGSGSGSLPSNSQKVSNSPSTSTSNQKAPSSSPIRNVLAVEEVSAHLLPPEETFFDSGTESGEDGGDNDISHRAKTATPPAAEFSSFMEGLRDTLTRKGLQKGTVKKGDNISDTTVPESDLIQQVEKVLTLVRDSLIQDPKSQNLKEGPMTHDLIALIDRLKASFRKSPDHDKALTVPSTVGSPSPPKEPDFPSPKFPKLPWATAAENSSEGPWKIRAAKKRGLVRSRSIGVSDEEIEEARRHLKEEAFRSAFKDVSPLTMADKPNNGNFRRKNFNLSRASQERPTSCYDDSSFLNLQNNFEDSRTLSLGTQFEKLPDIDPSKTFFTPEEVVQIAVHKAAIQKQVSVEEQLRRNSSSSIVDAPPKPHNAVAIKRDFSIGLPKPYVPPSSSSSDEHEGRGGPRRSSGPFLIKPQHGIENVQISLKETGDMPQLQIAITLNTNPSTASDLTKKVEGDGRSQREESSDESSKSFRYRSKSDRKKKMKRANTIDAPVTNVDLEANDEDEMSCDEPTPCPEDVKQPFLPQQLTQSNQVTAKIPSKMVFNRSQFFDKAKDPAPKPAFISAHDNYWNSRFSSLKTSFESSSQSTTPSVSPIPPGPCVRAHQPLAHAQPHLSPLSDQSVNSATKPVWATAPSPTGSRSPSSVLKKLSVFENRSTATPDRNIAHPWLPKNLPLNRNSALFRNESMERQLPDEPARPYIQQLSKVPESASIAPTLVASKSINEGVHTVHATKSALEAIQRKNQTQPDVLLPKNTEQHNTQWGSQGLYSRGVPLALQKFQALPQTPPSKFGELAPVHPQPKSNITLNKTKFENMAPDNMQSPFLMKPKMPSFDSEPRYNKLSVLRLANSFDSPAANNERDVVFPARMNLNSDEAATMNSPVVSRIMRGPQQQRATLSYQQMSSLGDNHPSAHRIRNASIPPPDVIGLNEFARDPPKFKFPPRSLQLPPLAKSNSGGTLSPGSKTHSPVASPMANPNIPRQKSLTDFQTQVFPASGNKLPKLVEDVSSPTATIEKEEKILTSKSVISNTSTNPLLKQSTSLDSLKRTSSGSSIFERAKSLYLSSRDTQSTQNSPQKKPPSLPKASSLFPKQFEAQMTPENAVQKQREVETYFKIQQENALANSPISTVPSRYVKAQGKGGGAYKHQIKKSASQGEILNRQKSFSDGEDEDDNVDQIFESLFKAAVESKMSKTSVCGDKTVSEKAETKATKSATEHKAVEKSASIEASRTPKGSTIVKKQSSVSTKSSSYAASTTTAQITTEKTTSGGANRALEGAQKNAEEQKSGNKIFEYTNAAVKSGAASVKDGLLAWCQGRTRAYKNVNITNFSSSWADGLAFCALIHHFFPTAFDYDTLSSSSRKKNFDLAFELADKLAGVYPLLETEDMLLMGKKPDSKCVFTYVNAMYLKLKDL